MCNNETDLKSIGERIKKARKKLNMAQDELAKELHCKREQISYYESGSREIKTGTLIELSKILGVSADYLLGLSNAETKNVEISGICDYTGLNENNVIFLNKCDYTELKSVLNGVLENRNFWATLERIIEYQNINEVNNPNEAFLGDLDKLKRQKMCEIWQLIEEVAKDGVNNGNNKQER